MIGASKTEHGSAAGSSQTTRTPSAEEGHAPRPRFALGTVGTLVVAFTLLAGAFAAALGFQLFRVAKMQHGIAELADHQREMHLALQLENAVRETYAPGHASGGPAARGDRSRESEIKDLLRRLAAAADEPGARALVRELEVATSALEIHERAAQAGVPNDRELYPLVFAVEDTVDRLFAFFREESVASANAIEQIRKESLRIKLVFAIALPLFALAIGLYLSRVIGRPLALVRDAAARISAGDLRTRIDPRGPPELAAIAAELNAMAASLEQHQERLLRSEKLAGLGRFAAGIAHEINNPLQVLIGYLSLHRGKVGGELGQDLARVEREAARCKEIVDALQQLSRPLSPPHGERVDLRALVDEVTDVIRVTTPELPAIRVAGSGDARGCRERFRQVLVNLLRNATEAAGPAGLVEVEVGAEGDTARVVVSDSGPGIPPEHLSHLFEPFFTTKPGGTGLGLALARAVAQAYGGDVELETCAGGARFRMTAPRHGAEARG